MDRLRIMRLGLPSTLLIVASLWPVHVTPQEGRKIEIEQRPFKVVGKVEDEMGAPIKGVTIKGAAWGLGDGRWSTTSDANGSFTLE